MGVIKLLSSSQVVVTNLSPKVSWDDRPRTFNHTPDKTIAYKLVVCFNMSRFRHLTKVITELTTYQFANSVKKTHIYSVFNIRVLIEKSNSRFHISRKNFCVKSCAQLLRELLILCGTLWYSVSSVLKKKCRAKLIGAKHYRDCQY